MRIINNIRNRKYNQAKLAKDPQPIQTFVENPIKSFFQLKKSYKDILNLLLGLRNNHVIVCPSLETIATKTNLSVKRVYEIIADLESWGFLNKIYDHFKSNIYIISSWFSNPKIRHQLRHILWSLRYVVIVPYLSTFFSEKDLRIEKCRQYYISSSLFINKDIILGNMDIKNDTLYVRKKNSQFQTEKKDHKRSGNMWENNKSDKVDLYKKYERPKTQQPFKKEQKEQKKITPPKEWQSHTIPKEEMKSPEEIVGKIVKLLETPNDFTKFAIKKLLDLPYLLEKTENEQIYIDYLDWKRREYGITAITVQAEPVIEKKEDIKKPIDYDKVREILKTPTPLDVKPIEIKRESSTLNEIEFEEVLDGTI